MHAIIRKFFWQSRTFGLVTRSHALYGFVRHRLAADCCSYRSSNRPGVDRILAAYHTRQSQEIQRKVLVGTV